MTKEEFIGKLQMCYFGDRNAFNEIVGVYDRLKAEYERIYNENCKLREQHNINDISLLDENNRLNNIINIILEFDFFENECPLNFEFEDNEKTKAQDIFYKDEYCENYCNNDYKKCWIKYFEELQKLKKDSD